MKFSAKFLTNTEKKSPIILDYLQFIDIDYKILKFKY